MRYLIHSLFFICITISQLVCGTENREKELSGRERLLSLVSGEWIAKSLYTAAELDIAGYLLDGPKDVQELALLTKCKEENLYRLLRMLASVGIFYEGENRQFSNTETSQLLAKEHPQSLHSLTLFFSQEMSHSWDRLLDCLREGKPAFDLSFGQPVFSYFRENKQAAMQFNAAMREKSRAVIGSCLQSFDFSEYKSVYDIGGGMGHFISALLSSYPEIHGVLYELPEVITIATKFLGGAERCSLVSGDFFQSVPKNGEAYLLKSILHDWNDADALKILEKCHEAMSNDSKLIIIEPIMIAANQKDHAKIMDVYMMVITGGKERTLEDFRNLLFQAGFSIKSVTPTETEFTILEAVRK